MSSNELDVVEPAASHLYLGDKNASERDASGNRDILAPGLLEYVLSYWIKELEINIPAGDIFDFGGGSRAKAMQELSQMEIFNKVSRRFISVDYNGPASNFDLTSLPENVEVHFKTEGFLYLTNSVAPKQLAAFLAMSVVEFFEGRSADNFGALAYHLSTKLMNEGLFIANTFYQGHIMRLNSELKKYNKHLVSFVPFETTDYMDYTIMGYVMKVLEEFNEVEDNHKKGAI